MPNRSRRIAVVAHCHLNACTKVHGLADYPGARTEIIAPLLSDGVGLVQLPCPEATYLGLSRWGMTIEQYDTTGYRRHCRALLEPILDTLTALDADGCVIERVIGVDGSPSCGVSTTCAGYGGGEISDLTAPPAAREIAGQGVLIQEFKAMLKEAGLDVSFEGTPERQS